MASATTKEVEREIPAIIRLYKDGSVERLVGSPYQPPSLDEDPQSKDITISQNPTISARLFLPKSTKNSPILPEQCTKFPILVYFHGGGFCIESAFSFLGHRYIQSLALEAQVLAVSIEYRLAPEHPLPAAYEDSWEALQWVASHSVKNGGEPWIEDYGDFDRFFIGGDSSGANIVHNIALRAGSEKLGGKVRISGAYLGHPYFLGSNPVGKEKSEDHDKSLSRLTWDFVYPSAPFGVDNPMINPASPTATTSLNGLGCSRVLVYVAGKDELRERGVWYLDLVRESGWKGEVEELFEVEEEDHCFHVFNLLNPNSQIMIKRLASFLNK
ncbi:2-hydroxyisoflavanone dehydratase-like [Euphorbia lathyris]|uniref:2-hydroxyisoflavanone dehydratase-like n=1 Tax=Euphorbia lathyris TaxID=212925 RepID=UPI00331358A9